jgi:uncharacterized protein (DUF2249 family)
MSDKETLDIRIIPRPQRHPLIFQTFENLQPGQSLQLVNDHDPAPLHNQFNFRLRGQFSWEYLKQGPETWCVRITRIAPAPVRTPDPAQA